MNYWDRVKEVLEGYYCASGQEVHMGKKHIFLDYDLSEIVDHWFEYTQISGLDRYIGPSHRIHIFFSRPNKCIYNDKLREFVENCNDVTNRKVIVHVVKSRPLLAKLIKGTLYGLDNCMIIDEDEDKQSTFVNNSGNSFISEITVGWNMGD